MRPRGLAFKWLLGAGAIGAGLAVLAAWATTPLLLVAGARTIAGEHPYCLYVPNEGSFGTHEIKRLSELAWPREHKRCGGSGPCDWMWEFHAVLAVENGPKRDLYNWSYSRFGFQPIDDDARASLHQSPQRCAARSQFLDRLSW